MGPARGDDLRVGLGGFPQNPPKLKTSSNCNETFLGNSRRAAIATRNLPQKLKTSSNCKETHDTSLKNSKCVAIAPKPSPQDKTWKQIVHLSPGLHELRRPQRGCLVVLRTPAAPLTNPDFCKACCLGLNISIYLNHPLLGIRQIS